ncbi:MAG: type II secretion system protein GspJ [Pseudohongiella sp.]|nr:type II secretion system protein GspJ [Pseudohongiella sp.]MDP2285195.1 type II secretion system protein GspJ [Pseudohongiella sp.]
MPLPRLITRSPITKKSAGFTLIELLVTLLLLATLATMSYRSLNVVLSARDRVNQQAVKWQQLGAFMNRFKQDVQLAAPYTVRRADTVQPAWHGRAGVDTARVNESAQELPQLEFSRFASVAGQDRLRRIGYTLNTQNELELWLWPGLDMLPGTEAARYVVLPGVSSITFEYMNAALLWVPIWPTAADDADIPRAVRFRLEMLDGDVLIRIFSLST